MSSSATPAVPRLEKLLRSGQIHTDLATLALYTVDGCALSAAVEPETAEEVAEVVRFAAAEKLALIPMGARTKLGIGMPPQRYDVAVDLRRLKSVAHYDPGDLTLSVDAGMPLGELLSLLAQHNQFLPLAVPYAAQTTVGGTIAASGAAGICSPLRQFYGTPRDFILGMEFVTGTGALTKSGGRVVKNVTGYDLHKLFVGSLGTLGIITRINFKTFPLPHASRGFVAAFSQLDAALELRHKIASSPLTPATLDIVSPQAAALLGKGTAGDSFRSDSWLLLAGYGGEPPVLSRYEHDLARMAQETGALHSAVLDNASRLLVWDRLREAVPLLLATSPASAILKISLLPSQLGEAISLLLAAAREAALPAAVIARAAGVVYFALLPESPGEQSLRTLANFCSSAFATAQKLGGYACVPWCPLELKGLVNIWGTPPPSIAMMQRVKSTFDPAGIFSPGRFL